MTCDVATITDFERAYRRAWEVPAPLTPAQWAERYRVLSRRQSSRPGRWSSEAAPALAGLMNLATHPRVRKLSVQKAGQVGASEAFRNVVGFLADREPDPVLLVLPNESHGRGIFADRILPLFEDTPRLRELLSPSGRDTTLSQVRLTNGFTIRLGWSGSAVALAANPARLVWNDEVDKFQPWVGDESDPVSLAEIRVATYANSIIINTSTPTTRDGLIFRLYDSATTKIAYHVPCPHCSAFAPLVFDQLKWPKLDITDKHQRAAAVVARDLACYVCKSCGAEHRDADRARMLMRGCWTTADGSWRLYVDGTEHGELPRDAEIGAHVWAVHSLAPKHRYAQIAAEFIRSEGDPMRTMNFRNGWLGEVHEVKTATTPHDIIRTKALSAAAPHVIPAWAVMLIATADVQKDHFWYVIRAWGYELKSQLVRYGLCHTFDELYRVGLESAFPIEGRAGEVAKPSYLLIDTGGSRTSEVYDFAKQDRRIVPCKGASQKMQRPWSMSPQPNGLTLRIIDTDYYKDVLHRFINDPDEARWTPHNAVNDDYAQQLVSEHKIFDRKRHKEIWIPVTSGRANHLWDCEVMQAAAADMANVGVSQQTIANASVRQQERARATSSLETWLPPKRW